MSGAGDIEYQAQKIQQSTTAFEFAEGLHGKAGMHSFFDGREHGPHSSALPPPTYYYTVPHPRLARCMGVFFLLALLLLHTQCSEEALCIITRRRMPRIASKRRNTPRAVL